MFSVKHTSYKSEKYPCLVRPDLPSSAAFNVLIEMKWKIPNEHSNYNYDTALTSNKHYVRAYRATLFESFNPLSRANESNNSIAEV